MCWLAGAALIAGLGPPVIAETLHAGQIAMTIEAQKTRYSFTYQGKMIVAVNSAGGIFLNGHPASIIGQTHCQATSCEFSIVAEGEGQGQVKVELSPDHATLTVTPQSLRLKSASLPGALLRRTVWLITSRSKSPSILTRAASPMTTTSPEKRSPA